MQRVVVGSEFCSWPKLEAIIDAGRNPRDQLLMLTSFKTGGRISEVLGLRKSQFDFNLSPHSIIIKDMAVEKKQQDFKRTLPILIKENLSDKWIELVHAWPHDVLFPGWDPRIQLTRRMALYITKSAGHEAGAEISNHWFRGMRASQLADEYEFDASDLRAFFKWQKKISDMAERYASISWRGLERRMLEGYENMQKWKTQA